MLNYISISAIPQTFSYLFIASSLITVSTDLMLTKNEVFIKTNDNNTFSYFYTIPIKLNLCDQGYILDNRGSSYTNKYLIIN